MLFPWYIKYPNQNDEILNLDWILSTIDNLVNEVANFVTLNTIKYADPIQWNITTQYEKNTVVIDPITGSAYISTQPVPSGVGLNNTDYWNVIFTLDVISANKNITLRDDANNILATFESEVDDWLLWQGTLYIVTRTIEIGQSYVVGYNIDRYTVERFLKEYITNLRTYVDTTIGDLDDLNTTDKTDVVAAINSLFQDLSLIIGDLTDLQTTDKNSLVEAINEVNGLITDLVGNLDDLETSVKTSIVAAINSEVSDREDDDNKINTKIDNIGIIDVLNYGATCDGITDDTDALKAALAVSENKILLLHGTMLISEYIPIGNNRVIEGNFATITVSGSFSGGLSNTNIFGLIGNNISIKNLTIDGSGYSLLEAGIIVNNADNVVIDNIELKNIYGRNIWIRDNNNNINVRNCFAHDGSNKPEINGTGAFCVAFNGTEVNKDIYFENCIAKNCGNAGFEMLDVARGYIINCTSESMSGAAGNWETANGFNIGSNCIVSGCISKNCANTGFYVLGSNNNLTSISVLTSGGTGIDFYTGGSSAHNNILDGALLYQCSTRAHSAQYNHMFVLGGTNQNVLTISDVLITFGGNNVVPIYGIEFENLVGGVIDNINIFNLTNMSKAVLLRGNSGADIIRNSRLDGNIQVDNPNTSNRFYNNVGESNPVSSLPITLGSAWNNTTGRTLAVVISGGSISEIALQNVIIGITSGTVIVPPGYLLQINGTGSPSIKYYYLS